MARRSRTRALPGPEGPCRRGSCRKRPLIPAFLQALDDLLMLLPERKVPRSPPALACRRGRKDDALRVANVPAGAFEAAVESEEPTTIKNKPSVGLVAGRNRPLGPRGLLPEEYAAGGLR